jgi:heme oxygenase
LIETTITRESYARSLSQLWHVHSTLEHEISSHLCLTGFANPDIIRLHSIQRDLAFLNGQLEPAWPETDALCQQLRDWSQAEPYLLLGALYILEGSRMGSMVLVGPLSRALQVPMAPHQGLDYHLEGMERRPACWQRFKAALLALPLTPALQEKIIKAATLTMDALYRLYAAFAPGENSMGYVEPMTGEVPVAI